MVRGIERRPIFLDDADRRDLLERLSEILPDSGASSPGWAFIPNHVHAIIRTGEVPLSRVMRRLNTGFAVRFNLRHERAGYLFQNRFRSRLVTDDDDLQGLLRYVLLNPLEAGLVPNLAVLERFPWCGYGALLGVRDALPFEDVRGALALFAESPPVARSRLRSWMAKGTEAGPQREDPEVVAEPAQQPPRRELASRGSDGAGAAPSLEALVARICLQLGCPIEELLRGSKAATTTRARALICHIAVVRWRLPTLEVARALGVSPSAVSHALARGARIASEEGERFHSPRGE
jgi:REP element-mobilizing transposase RayT